MGDAHADAGVAVEETEALDAGLGVLGGEVQAGPVIVVGKKLGKLPTGVVVVASVATAELPRPREVGPELLVGGA